MLNQGFESLCLMQAEEAEVEARQMLDIYAEFATQVAAIAVVPGRKSRIESFAGANTTYTIEAMMGDKRALQVTYLFSKVTRTFIASGEKEHAQKGWRGK